MKNDDIHFECACGTRLRAAAKSAGHSVRCPSCKSAVAVPEPEPPFEVVGDDEPAEPEAPADAQARSLRKKKRAVRQRRQALNRVQIGLTLFVVEFLLRILANVLALIIVFVVRRSQSPTAALAGGIALLVIGLAPPVVAFIGSVCCLAAPKAARIRGFMVGSLVCTLVGLVGHAVAHLLGAQGVVRVVLAAMFGLIYITAWVLFMSFLKGLAEFLRERGSATEADALLWYGLAIQAAAYFGPLLVGLIAFVLPCIGLLVVLGLFIWWLVASIMFLIRYYNLLINLRDAVA